METISITIPVTESALKRTSAMLNGMLEDLVGTQPSLPMPEAVIETTNHVEPVVEEEEEDNGLDSEGMPWDHRIHAATKSKIADGTWRLKKGVSKEDVDEVKALYLGNDDTTESESIEPTVTLNTEVTPPPPPPPPPPASAPVTTFPEIMAAFQASGMPMEAFLGACQLHGLSSIPMLATRPDLIPTVAAEMGWA